MPGFCQIFGASLTQRSQNYGVRVVISTAFTHLGRHVQAILQTNCCHQAFYAGAEVESLITYKQYLVK